MKNEIEILLVENNPNNAELALKTLKNNYYFFSRGSHKSENSYNIPKLILPDLKMPEIDGLEVLKMLKYNEVTKLIPVVVHTSSHEEDDMVESYRLGVNSYIVKLGDYDKFIDSVKDIGLYWLLLNQQPDVKNLIK